MKDLLIRQVKRLNLSLFKAFTPKPDVVIQFGVSLGDDLLCTILAKQLKEHGYKQVWMKTCYPEIFFNNPFVDRVIETVDWNEKNPIERDYLKGEELKVIVPWYVTYNKEEDKDTPPAKHIVHVMCDIAGVGYPQSIKPLFYLTKEEVEKGKLFENQICIQSSGKGSRNYMSNKDWAEQNFNELVQFLKDRYTVIQLGSKDDALLPGVIDKRGKTTIRESGAILHNSLFFIGTVGFLMHLARAVDCKSVIIYGGRERPDQTGYMENINLYTQLTCSPCWYRNDCLNIIHKECMKEISVHDVLNAVSVFETHLQKERYCATSI